MKSFTIDDILFKIFIDRNYLREGNLDEEELEIISNNREVFNLFYDDFDPESVEVKERFLLASNRDEWLDEVLKIRNLLYKKMVSLASRGGVEYNCAREEFFNFFNNSSLSLDDYILIIDRLDCDDLCMIPSRIKQQNEFYERAFLENSILCVDFPINYLSEEMIEYIWKGYEKYNINYWSSFVMGEEMDAFEFMKDTPANRYVQKIKM